MKKDAKQIEKPAENTINLIPRKLKAKEWKDIGNQRRNSRKKDIKNQKFGRLTVLEFVGIRKNHQAIWKCKCDCGKTTKLSTNKICGGYTKSCGCLRKRTKQNNPLYKGFREIGARLFKNIKRGAAKRKIPYLVSPKDCWSQLKKQKHLCPYTKERIIFDSRGSISDGNASLDRIDSSKGYVNGNIQWVIKPVNLMKHIMSHNEFVAIIKKIHNNL